MLWLGTYRVSTPGIVIGDNGSFRFDPANRPQPDAYLRIPASLGGKTVVAADGYVEGPPELIVEVSASYDLHEKLDGYRRNGVDEYVVWRTYQRAIDWFILREGRYEPLPPGLDGIFRSEAFPGLWLHAPALIRGELAAMLQVLQRGLATPEYAAFVAKLAAAAAKPKRRPEPRPR